MRRMSRWLAWVVVAALASPAAAQTGDPAGDQTQLDYFAEQTKTPLTYRVEGTRTRNQKIVLLSLAGATVVAGGLAGYFHLESKHASDDVTEKSGEHSGRTYTPEVDARRQEGVDARTRAIAMYVVGGALLATTLVYYIATSPDDEIRAYESSTTGRVAAPFLAPVEGGAIAGKAWSF
jgi:hypothetical protein